VFTIVFFLVGAFAMFGGEPAVALLFYGLSFVTSD